VTKLAGLPLRASLRRRARTRSRTASRLGSGNHTAVNSPARSTAPDWPHPAGPS
jgi:hypothetical protein